MQSSHGRRVANGVLAHQATQSKGWAKATECGWPVGGWGVAARGLCVIRREGTVANRGGGPQSRANVCERRTDLRRRRS
jgi:hypothetical protein